MDIKLLIDDNSISSCQIHPSTPLRVIILPDNLPTQYKEINKKQNKCKRNRLPLPATYLLFKWFNAHLDNPYPTEEEKQQLTNQTGLSRAQINSWIGGTRYRYFAKQNK